MIRISPGIFDVSNGTLFPLYLKKMIVTSIRSVLYNTAYWISGLNMS